jgi:hypothetical protein
LSPESKEEKPYMRGVSSPSWAAMTAPVRNAALSFATLIYVFISFFSVSKASSLFTASTRCRMEHALSATFFSSVLQKAMRRGSRHFYCYAPPSSAVKVSS